MSAEDNRTYPVYFAESWASVYFDLLRGLAAIIVVISHWNHLFFLPYVDLVSHRLLLLLPYLFMGTGRQAVMVFFVLSGYFIGGVVFRDVERNQWSWATYFLRRLVRLWIVLIPALLLGLLWDRWALYLNYAPALYSGHTHRAVTDIARLLAPHIFLSNLFFLQTLVTPVFGSNSALWSLANEFWYYILFPIGVLAFRRRSTLIKRVLYISLFLAVSWFVRGDILKAFPIWLLGAGLSKLKPLSLSSQTARIVRLMAILFYVPYFVTIRLLHSIPSILNDYSLGVATFIFLWLLLPDRDAYDPDRASVRVSRTLASFSYTLYAVHTPILLFMTALLVGDLPWTPTLRTVGLSLIVLFGVFVYAYFVAKFTEFKTYDVRRRLERIAAIPLSVSAMPSLQRGIRLTNAIIPEPVLHSPIIAASASKKSAGLSANLP